MKAPVVMDSSAMIAVALQERRGSVVIDHVRAHPGNCFIHAVNAFEVVTVLVRKGLAEADAWNAVTFGGVLVSEEVTETMTRFAVALKLSNKDFSLGDCHCLAFAEEMGGSLLTTEGDLANAASKAIKAVHVK